MLKIFLVFLGGGFGAVSRFLVTNLLAGKLGNFPLGTLAVNFFGSLLMGLLIGVFAGRSQFEPLRLFLAVGFLGGFTTFSSFSAETLTLFQNGQIFAASVNVFINVIAALAACAVGFKINA